MSLETLIRKMPKVELHVHLEGSIQPETFLTLARRHKIHLPADDLAGLRRWYAFTDFGHFIEVYLKIAASLKSPKDIEWIAREFLSGQAQQNIQYCEIIYTPYNQFLANGIPFDEQIDALNRARTWARADLGIECQFIMDISRETQPEEGLTVARWAISAMDQGVCALGLGGPERGNPPEKFQEAFALAREAGLPAIPHAGETEGPDSIRGALTYLHPARIEHGVRCMEDPDLVDVLRARQIPLDVCPTSNICLKVFPSLDQHPLREMMDAGLFVTLNSDDPPLFNTTLTDEYLKAVKDLGLTLTELLGLVNNGIRAALLPEARKETLLESFARENAALFDQIG
jgi:adenosine deaminase